MNETQSNLIDKYLSVGLTEQETEQFESWMADQDFAEEVTFRKTLAKAGREGGRTQLKQLFEEMDQEMDGAKQARIIPFGSGGKSWYMWGAAASILLLFTFLLWPGSSSNADQQLFAAHYTPFSNQLSVNQRTLSEQYEFFKAYEKGKYAKAVRLLEEETEMSQNQQLYYGLSLMMLKKRGAEAIPVLEPIAGDAGSRWQDAAQWYLCLAQLKLGNREVSQSLLEQILSDSDHAFWEDAKALQADL